MSLERRLPRDCSISTATEADIQPVLALWRRAGGPASGTDDERAIRGLLTRDEEALLVARVDGEIVGSLIAGWDGWRGSFYRLAVDPDWQRQGIATTLIRAGEKRLRNLGARRLTAIAISDDDAATAIWAASGYERQANRSRFVRMPDV